MSPWTWVQPVCMVLLMASSGVQGSVLKLPTKFHHTGNDFIKFWCQNDRQCGSTNPTICRNDNSHQRSNTNNNALSPLLQSLPKRSYIDCSSSITWIMLTNQAFASSSHFTLASKSLFPFQAVSAVAFQLSALFVCCSVFCSCAACLLFTISTSAAPFQTAPSSCYLVW